MNETYASPILSLVIISIFALVLLVIAINYIVRRRVSKETQHIYDACNTMQQAINLIDKIVIDYNIGDEKYYNISGNRLMNGGMTRDEIRQRIHPDYQVEHDAFIDSLINGDVQEGEFEYLYNSYGHGDVPQWHTIRNHATVEYDNEGRRTHVICDITDIDQEILVHRMDGEMTDKYQLIFENSIIGISFYDVEGHLIDANRRMREICNFKERYDSVFYETTFYDLAAFPITRETLDEMWFCMHMEIPKLNLDKYVEVRVHPIYDNNHMQYIALAVRDVTNERSLYMQQKENEEQIREANQEIIRHEKELRYLLDNNNMHVWRSTFATRTIEFSRDLRNIEHSMSYDEFIGRITSDNRDEVLNMISMLADKHDSHSIVTCEIKNPFAADGECKWYNMNSIPEYDKDGQQIGCFGLIRDVTTLIHEQQQLKRETERANDSGRQKSVFLANMTHEIRTPLNAIVGFSDLLQAIEAPEEKLEMMRIIHNNCDMLLRLVNDFLVISSIESNGLEINPAEIDFAHEFHDMCHGMEQRISNPAVAYQIDNPYSSLHAKLDKDRISQVITNFVTNAVKYTQEGHIKVGYRIQDNGIYIYCEDTGCGIPKEDQARVFERFVKLNDYIQGTGLGLSICKAIADQCGGKIGVESEVGKGSTFWFWTPCDIQEPLS